MPRKKKKSNNYYTKIQDVAICAYNKSDNPAQREKIYRRFIYPPFLKLTENLINKMRPTYILNKCSFQDLQTDLVTYLTARLDKFKPNAGKSYSYYTRTSFNYLIAENQKAYVKVKQNREPNIEDFNKKALYIFIRERTGLPTTNVTRVVKTLKHLYETKFREYADTEFMNLPF